MISLIECIKQTTTVRMGIQKKCHKRRPYKKCASSVCAFQRIDSGIASLVVIRFLPYFFLIVSMCAVCLF